MSKRRLWSEAFIEEEGRHPGEALGSFHGWIIDQLLALLGGLLESLRLFQLLILIASPNRGQVPGFQGADFLNSSSIPLSGL
jgi:hypothetical protein